MARLIKIPALIAAGVVRFYQLAVSPFFPPACRYTPSCSEYSIQALQKYGFFRGIILSVHRVIRCNPWGGHGYDPPVWYTEQRPNQESYSLGERSEKREKDQTRADDNDPGEH